MHPPLAGSAGLAGLNALVKRLEKLLQAAELPGRLADHGVPRSAIAALAEVAAQQWTAMFNPRAVNVADFVALYETAF